MELKQKRSQVSLSSQTREEVGKEDDNHRSKADKGGDWHPVSSSVARGPQETSVKKIDSWAPMQDYKPESFRGRSPD